MKLLAHAFALVLVVAGSPWPMAAVPDARAASTSATHPLEPLSAAEFTRACEIVRGRLSAMNLPTEHILHPFIALDEPPKAFVLAWRPGEPFPRAAIVHVLHYPSNRLWVATVDLLEERVRSFARQRAGTQAASMFAEYDAADALVRAHAPWREAMRQRGIDPALVYLDIWAAGVLDPAEVPRTGPLPRLMRAIAFHRAAPVEEFDPATPQNPYARPIEGVVVTVDMSRRQVVGMVDTLRRPVTTDTGNAEVKRLPLKPLLVSEPQGSNVTLNGRRVSWQGWHFCAALAPREGLVLYDVRYEDAGVLRPIAYRMSLSELFVPYGVPDANWVFRGAFDVGEYNLGLSAQSMGPNRDVSENALYLDAVFGSDTGPTLDNPTGTFDYPRTIALYERHSGILWSRTDPTTFDRDVRRGRELVVTWNAAIGNYTYVFDWIFKMDASIEVRVHATGSLLPRGAGPSDEPTAPVVGIDPLGTRVLAGVHQHFINFRLDLDVDGPDNRAFQSDIRHVPVPGFRNAFAAEETPITRESFADVDRSSARTWHVASASRRNALGHYTGYELHPGDSPVPYADTRAAGLGRQPPGFAVHPVWFTRYKDGELYAGGDFPNLGPEDGGLSEYVRPPQSLEAPRGVDIVLWHTIGFSHIPRPEDHPVMVVESVGFKLMPHGFFVRAPALDVPDQSARP